jgi:RNA polymerase sigma factor (sigma-70 family)
MGSSALAAGVRQLRGMAARQHRADETDEQLLHAFAVHRDEAAFAALVRRHGPMVLGVCRRVLHQEQDAEDAFQATFLVLARRAEILRKKTALTSFLHGTTYRMALMVKRSAARRRKHEARTPARSPADPSGDLLWHEVQTLLDEEITRLPEIYRSVFVLCCLESLSRAEAARRLGLKEGTVSSRLAQAKQRLQERLARRGVELTAVLAALALSAQSASALPARLFARMSRAAVSPAVVALAENGLGISKVKLATAIVLAASVLTGAGAWACRGLTAHAVALPVETPEAKSASPRVAPAEREARKRKAVEIHGRVLGPYGQPKAGAKLLLLGADQKITELGVTAADGRFAVAVPKTTAGQYLPLIAQADGAGIDFLDLGRLKSGKPIELRLVKDHAIRGRVVNTEGKPVADVRVAIRSVNVYPNNSLDSFLAAWKKRENLSGIPRGEKNFWSEASVLLPTTTDADGRFTLRGVGEERLALLRFSGAGIADAEVWVVNREALDLKPYNQATRDNTPKGSDPFGSRELLHGPDVSIVVESEKPIRGVVKDADTGKGRPGVVVHLTANNDGTVMPIQVRAKTDAQGRYQIRGAHKAEAYLLEVESDPLAGYMPCQVWADDSPGYQPINADIGVKKGVIITGKVLDQMTGQPSPATLTPMPLSTIRLRKSIRSSNLPDWDTSTTPTTTARFGS